MNVRGSAPQPGIDRQLCDERRGPDVHRGLSPTVPTSVTGHHASSRQPRLPDDASPPSEPAPAPPSGGPSPPVRGTLIVLEGLDRSGKTTQVSVLEQRLVEAGRKVKVMRFPGTFLG